MKIEIEGKEYRSKTAFVAAQPHDVPAKDVVEIGAKHGVKLSVAQVYNIRSTSKAPKDKAKPKARLTGTPRKSRIMIPKAASSTVNGSNSSAVDTMRRAVAELGLSRAREVLNEVSAAFGA